LIGSVSASIDLSTCTFTQTPACGYSNNTYSVYMDSGKATAAVTVVADNTGAGSPKLDYYSHDTSIYVSPFYQQFFVFYTLGDDYHNPITQTETYFDFYLDY
jgi:hypothetical protein